MLMKRNTMLRDAETNKWLKDDLELYPLYVEENVLSGENQQGLTIIHTTFMSQTNAFIAYLKGGKKEEFSGLKLAVRVSDDKYIQVGVKTMGKNSLFDLLLNDWSKEVDDVEVYGKTMKDHKSLLKDEAFVAFLTKKMKGLHRHLKAVKISFSKEFPIPERWKSETYESKLHNIPNEAAINLKAYGKNLVVLKPQA